MLYANYQNKILKAAKALTIAHRFRYLILAVFSATFLSVGTLVGTKGLVSDSKKVLPRYTYGQEIKFESSSFMSDVSYEFTDIAKEEWTLDKPSKIGKYKMRGRGKNSFNSYYYGSEQTFEIIPKPIEVFVKEDEITYGERPTIDLSSVLEFGDTLSNDYTFDYGDKEEEDWTIKPTKESLHIYSKTGEDVTKCYTFNIKEKLVNILKIPLSIETLSASKTYDKEALECDEFEIVQGELVKGDSISVLDYPTLEEVGEIDNELGFVINDAEGNDVTIHYDITTTNGLLTVEPIPISFSIGDFEHTYDGKNKKFSFDDIKMEGEILSDHEVEFSYKDEDTWKNVGEYENIFDVKVKEEDVDVTSCYDITTEFGKTTINKRDVTIVPQSSTRDYNGKPLVNTNFDVTEGSIAPNQTALVMEYSSITDVGEVKNIHTVAIYDLSFNDVTSNYNITMGEGTLKVEAVKIEAEAIHSTVQYDGYTHSVNFSYDASKLVGEDTLSFLNNIEKINVGTYDLDDVVGKVTTIGGTDNTSNYEITCTNTDGALTITRRPLSLTLNSFEQLYDGEDITEKDFEKYTITSGTLADNEYLDVNYLQDYINAGEYNPISAEINIYHKVGANPDKSKDTLVTSNYELNVDFGEFSINKRLINIQGTYVEHEYDRDPSYLQTHINEYLQITGDGLVEGHTITGIVVSDVGINVGSYAYTLNVENMKIYEGTTNVTDNYLIVLLGGGTFNITKRQVSFKMLSATHVYDGNPFSSSAYQADNLLPGDYLVFTGLPSVTYVEDGVKDNVPIGITAYTSEHENVTDNYAFLIKMAENGTISILPKPVTIKTQDITKTFDNVAIIADPEITFVGSGLVGDDYYVITTSTCRDDALIHAGVYENQATIKFYNSEDRDITQSYSVTWDFGTITIKPRPLKLDIREEHIVYDGQTHDKTYSQSDVTSTSANVYLSSGSLPAGFTLSSSVTIEDMKEVGSYDNYITSNTIYYGMYEYGFPQDFSITYVNNSQQVIERNITLRTVGGSKIYDGKIYGYGLEAEDLYDIISGSLAEDHELIVTFSTHVEPSLTLYQFEITGYQIIDKADNDKDVTHNYNVTCLSSEVRIYEV